ncbi:MAG: glycosyltransferase family 9 protein [Thermomicrobiales bacterium]
MSGWLDAKNLLAVRLDNAGDVIMLGPALRAVKESAPAVHLTLLATPAGESASALLPWVDDVIVWRPVWQDLGRSTSDPQRDRQLIELLQRRGFDGALIFTSFSQTPHVPGYVCYLAGIPLRAGESTEFGGATLTDELRGAPVDIHQVERNLRLVEYLGFTVRDRRLRIFIPDSARNRATELVATADLNPNEGFVLVHPGASARARRLPLDRLRPALTDLSGRGFRLLLTGSEREQAWLTTFACEVGLPVLSGATTLPEFAALIEKARVVVCGNTLPLHLADAVGTPLVVLYAGTDLVSQWQPRSSRCRLLRRETACTPCYLFDCPIDQMCLEVASEEISSAIIELLNSPQEQTLSAVAEDAA